MDAKHSLLPWRVFDEAFPSHHSPGIEAPQFSVVIWGNEGEQQGVQGHTAEEARANADFIVRCVNSHDELLAALKAIVAVLQKEAPGTPLNHHRYDAIGAQALKAIAKAEGHS